MNIMQHKGKYIGYDDDGKVVIISHNKKIVIKYMQKETQDVMKKSKHHPNATKQIAFACHREMWEVYMGYTDQ
jgi:hypothetical protein